MLNLFGKVSMDASGFTQAMAKMKATAGPAGAQIGQQIKGKMLEAFGAGAAIALFKSSLEKAVEIKKGAIKSGLDTTTFQALSTVAEDAGSSVEELIKILEQGGPEADDLSTALKDAQEELVKMGRIIDEDAVKSLAGLSAMMEMAFGRVAPVMSKTIDFLLKLYEVGSALTQATVGLGARAVGSFLGNNALAQAGNAVGLEALSGHAAFAGESKKSSIEIASEAAARAVRGDGGSFRQSSKHGKQLDVSSLVAAGAIFNGGTSSTNKTLETMNAEVARIRKIIEKGRD